MLYTRWRPDGPVTRGLAAVGRTAFTNYLLQTVIATTVFYGHGLGLFGSVSRVEQLGFVVAVWAVQIVLSVLWLRRFRFGPVEWGVADAYVRRDTADAEPGIVDERRVGGFDWSSDVTSY